MTDWYVYHSAETMGRPYGHPKTNHVFSKTNKPKLCLNSNIWVIEGFGQSPKKFCLAAHFSYQEIEYPPFPSPYTGGKYADFVAMYAGPGESFGSKCNLTFFEHPWFEELHKKFINAHKLSPCRINDHLFSHRTIRGMCRRSRICIAEAAVKIRAERTGFAI